MAFRDPLAAHIRTFDCDEDPSNTSARWEKWLSRFENYLVAKDITVDGRKKAQLLLMAGEKVYDIYDTMLDAEDKFDDVKAKLNNYFKPMKDTAMAIFLFRETAQKVGETCDQYVTRLKGMAKHCEFVDTNSEIRAQIVQKTLNKKLRREVLKHPAWKLEDVLQEARSLEASETHAGDIERTNIDDPAVNFVKGREKPSGGSRNHARSSGKPQEQTNKSTCYKCGGSWPHEGGIKKCPARERKCNHCQMIGHYSKVCRKKKDKIQQSGNVHQVNEEQSQDDDEYLFKVGESLKLPHANVKVGKYSVKFLVDTGSSLDIIDKGTYRNIGNPALCKSRTSVFPYDSNTALKVLGQFSTCLETKKQYKETNLIVIDTERAGNILSYNTASALGLVKVTTNSISNTPITQGGDPNIIQRYPQLFTGVGKLKGYQAVIHTDPSVTPIAQRARRVPFHLRKRVEEEIKRLKELDIIEDAVGPSTWVSPVVFTEKKSGEIRLCVDSRQVNKAVVRERYPGPTIHDLVHDLNGAKIFSNIDMREGFHQIELSTESRNLTTFTTHCGVYRFKRLLYGISSAPELFQKLIEQVVSDIPGVKNIADDIIIYGPDQASHDRSLTLLFDRLVESGLTLRPEKCHFNKDHVTFYGFIWGRGKLSPDTSKVQAINNLSTPKDPYQVRSMLGMTNYCSRFIPRYSDITAPLRELTKDGAEWEWGESQEAAFNSLKEILTSKPTLAYFDPCKETEILTDASPVGLSAILTQRDKDNKVYTVAYASKALSYVEQRYSQTDREALGVIWACEHFHLYVYGKPFTVFTDHRALVPIYMNPKIKTTVRLERYALRLTPYQVTVKYRPGKDNPADHLSRDPLPDPNPDLDPDHYVNFIANHCVPKAMNIQEIKSATLEDATLQEVARRVRSGDWHTPAPPGVNGNLLSKYKNVKDELCVSPDADLILRGTRLVISETLQSRCLSLAHEGHLGLVKTKQLLREKVWFPYIDRNAEALVKNCLACQATTTSKYPAGSPKMSDLPSGVWEEISVDFWGPTPDGTYAFVLIDDYSRYPVVELVKSVSADTIIPLFDKVYSNFGIPYTCRSDNGPPFQSHKFSDYCDHIGCKHRKVTPLWPRANGEAERFMQNLVKIATAAKVEGRSWKQELYKFLRNYRNTPHPSTGKTPASLMFGRPVRIKLPSTADLGLQGLSEDQEVRRRDNIAKEKMAGDRLKTGDKVLVKAKKQNKFTSKYDPKWYEVIGVKGSMITAERDDHVITRNDSFFKKYSGDQVYTRETCEGDAVHIRAPQFKPVAETPITIQTTDLPTPPLPQQVIPEQNAERTTKENAPTSNTTPDPPGTPMITRARRERKRPAWFQDYAVDL